MIFSIMRWFLVDDKIIASYLKKDGSKGHYLPYNENSKSAHWDSQNGLTLSSTGREQFFPKHRIMEVNRFSDPEVYALYSIQQDPVIDQFYEGDKGEMEGILLEMSESFDSADFNQLKDWISENTEIKSDAVKGSLVRIALSSELVESSEETEVSVSEDQGIQA